uniref:Uncharacterized protein n=1 Tax=Pararge aegeria TaxID=116150 RepID=S4PXF2_9NEOP
MNENKKIVRFFRSAVFVPFLKLRSHVASLQAAIYTSILIVNSKFITHTLVVIIIIHSTPSLSTPQRSPASYRRGS